MFDVCVIGHITKDVIKKGGQIVKELPGGAAYYTSVALRSLGLKVAVITRLSQHDKKHLLCELEKNGIVVFDYESERSTVFENIYPEENFDFRVQKVRAVASPFSALDWQGIEAKIYHIGPLTNKEFSTRLLKEISEGGLVSLDAQGFLRKVENSEVKKSDWPEKRPGLGCVDILKVSEDEVKTLSEEDDIEKAAVRLSEFGPKEIIVTMASTGALIFYQDRFYRIPALPPRKTVDPTGCGDTYVAGYIFQRLKGADIDIAGRFASALATLKLENFGPFHGTETKVEDLMSRFC